METATVLSSTQISANYLIGGEIGHKLMRIPIPNIRKTLVQASPKFQSQRAPNEKPPFMISKEDLDYMVKLGCGSVVGAAAIKYGSIILPQITRPNILVALVIISAPLLLAVSLLIILSPPPTK